MSAVTFSDGGFGSAVALASSMLFCSFKPSSINFNHLDLKPYFTKQFLWLVVKRDFLRRLLESVRKKKPLSSEGEGTGGTSGEAVLASEKEATEGEADLTGVVESKEDKTVEIDVAKIEAVPETQETKQQTFARQALVCIGEYPAEILMKGQLARSKQEVQPVFINKSSEEVVKWGKDELDAEKITGLDANVDTQFWYQVSPWLAENQGFFDRVRSKLEGNEFGVLTVSSLWDGIGSALSPALISKFKEWNMSAVTLALCPSRLQPSAAHFNTLSSVINCLATESAVLILVDRDQLNKYVGVDRAGSVIVGNTVLNSIVQMMLAKESFVKEFSETSRSFGVKVFAILAAMGASLKVYGSLENILSSTTIRPLQAFDVPGASILYALVRLPNLLRDEFSREKIELIIADWFKNRAALKSVYVAEPLYAEDLTDRIDLLLFVGGFSLTGTLALMKKKAEALKTQAIKQGSMKEEEWKELSRAWSERG